MSKWVYGFGEGMQDQGEGTPDKTLLGGKGAGLAQMSSLGVPVPPGFTISTEACVAYLEHGGQWPEGLAEEVSQALRALEKATGKKFGDPKNPLLLSVRSGARSSMPGMMDTVLNVGINDEVSVGMGRLVGNPRFALDCQRRFIHMFSDVVLGLKPEGGQRDPFEICLERHLEQLGRVHEKDLDENGLRGLVEQYTFLSRRLQEGKDFPQDPDEQLKLAISAVFKSWFNHRAKTYRRLHNIPESWGTAVNVQAMVFGNLGDTSGTGVAFTRDPATGEPGIYGEYLVNAQGEDVVAGLRTPSTLRSKGRGDSLEEVFPELFTQLLEIGESLENHFGDMQDLEFTIERKKLYLLQTRNGKRTGFAALRIATDLVEEGKCTAREVISKVEPQQLPQLLAPVFDPAKKQQALQEGHFLAKGLNAGPGAASGLVAFTAERAEELVAEGKQAILVRNETSPEDLAGMVAAEGVLTAKGGMTSHAAVVARGMGKPCIVGCGDLRIDLDRWQVEINGVVIRDGEQISMDGSTGEVFKGAIPTKDSEILACLESDEAAKKSDLFARFNRFLGWCDEASRMKVRANAETPRDATIALSLGAIGIGLCRTEHMFFDTERIGHVREMIIADNDEDRQKALAFLLPYQREDFVELFKIMNGRPLNIRLLDPPLHEFLPHDPEQMRDLANLLHQPLEVVRQRVRSLEEVNPMLGHRGCRLSVTYPSIQAMQVRAILEAALMVQGEGIKVDPEIMIPLVTTDRELKLLTDRVHEVAKAVFEEQGGSCPYLVGTMIETPRAAITADRIGKVAQFFSFGTNDLTQMTFGYSRDDSGSFLPEYVDKGLLPQDPFVSVDGDGVGFLVEEGVKRGRSANAALKIGVCGEHGGEPESVQFFHRAGLDYVSCSPYRVPTARLAAAQASVNEDA